MATTVDGIWTPDQGDDYNLVGDLGTMSASIQTALEKRANVYRGTTAQRSNFTNGAPEGVLWVDTNGAKQIWVKQGNTWELVWPIVESDTGWTTSGISFSAQYEQGAVPFQVRKVGSQVFMRGEIRKKSGTIASNSHVTAARVPVGMRPSIYMLFSGEGNHMRPIHCRMNTDGQITVRDQLNLAGNPTAVSLSMLSYMADD